MKNFYTLALAAAVTMGAAALTPAKFEAKSVAQFSKAAPVGSHTSLNDRVLLRQTPSGHKIKEQRLGVNSKITIGGKSIARRAAEETTEGVGISEDFEGWDGQDLAWLPEGWTRKITDGLEVKDSWSPASGVEAPVPIEDGDVAMFCNFNNDVELDEWLITPEFTVQPSMQLTYLEMTVPFYMYSWDNIDWDTYEYIGEPIPVGDFKVMITTDGGENWTLLRSVAEEYKSLSLMEVMEVHQGEFYDVCISLAAYEGKNVKIAFCQQGRETNSVAIDAVIAGNPSLPVTMENPWSMLNYGLSKESDCMPYGIGHIPAYAPNCWVNAAENFNADYTWVYQNENYEETTKASTKADPDLILSYPPTYVDPTSEYLPYYFAPILKGTAEGFSEGVSAITDCLAVGGDPVIDMGDEDGSINFGVTVPNFAVDSYDLLTNPDYFGEPLLGYAPHSDQYWSNYTYKGNQDDNNYVKLISLINAHVAPEAPMVVKGAWVPALAQFKGEAQLKMELVALTEEGEPSDQVLASATTSSNDAIDWGEGFCVIPFTFDVPALISQDVCYQYIVRLSGFNNPDSIQTFAPLHSELGDPMQRAMGWAEKQLVSNGNIRTSLSPLVNYTGTYNSFYFMLDAAYPYFKPAADDTVILPAEGTAEVAADSYYTGADFTVTAPEWVKAEVVGKGAEAKVVFAGSGKPDEAAEVTLAAPGVSHTFKVQMSSTNSIATIDEAATTPTIYNLQGRRVLNPTTGLHIINGTKTLLK